MISPVQIAPSRERWHYTRDGLKFGPTDLGGLRRMAQCMHLLPDSLVWSDGLAAWVPAMSIETLSFPQKVAVPPPIPTAAADSRYSSPYRSSDDCVILGVCGGLAHRFDVPTEAVRVLVAALFPLMIGWAYFLGAFLPALPTKKMLNSEESPAAQSG